MSSNPYKPPKELAGEQTGPRIRPLRVLFSVICILGLLFLFVIPATRRGARPAAWRMQCSNNLKQIALALHNYEEEYGTFPPAYTVDAQQRPLHSWRTLLLPFLEQQPLYDSLHLDKPWNDPANAAAYDTSLNVYRCPADELGTLTTYLAVVEPNGCFHLAGARRLEEITDSRAETLMVIEVSAEHAVHWMAPQDTDADFVLGFGPHTKFAHSNGTQAAFVDGSIHFLSVELTRDYRRAIISIAGNDSVSTDQFE